MPNRQKTLKERGRFKEIIHSALYKSENIKELLLGDTSKMSKSEILGNFKKHVFSHLYVNDTVANADTFIYYDVSLYNMRENVKGCRVIMYVIAERTTIDNYYKEGFCGNKTDILSDMVEDALVNDVEVANKFGIGELRLESVDIYSASRFYGTILTFTVPNFR